MKPNRNAPVNERTLYGGQAVVEGVMMRSPRFFAVACRRLSNGEIVLRQENVESMMARWQWLNKPFLRGTLALIDAMAMGFRALTYAANVQAADELAGQSPAPPAGKNGERPEPAAPAKNGSAPQHPTAESEQAVEQVASQSINSIAIGTALVIAFVLGFLIFWELPAALIHLLQLALHIQRPTVGQSVAFNVGEGLVRIAIFLAYVALISLMAHVRRVFQYHGAEHKAINALEAGRPLTLESARQSSRIHPRCGTNFIFLVLIVILIIDAAVFTLIPKPPFWAHLLVNVILLPIVAGISFEILKFAGNHRERKWAQWLVAPGLATQYLTTREPDDSQIEVALAALNCVWDKEHAPAPQSEQAPVGEEAPAAAAVA